LVGGGNTPKPGEITLAHHGVLFLDEFPEFDKRVIESLRQPLEDKMITVSRARGTNQFPANFILIATMNPCPCGNLGSARKQCICSQAALQRYTRKLSGPIVDRIDLWVEVPQVDYDKLSMHTNSGADSSRSIREQVVKARKIQGRRFARLPNINTNAEMGVKELEAHAFLNNECREVLNTAAKRLDLSARAYHRVQKLARTIADLAASEHITPAHLLEALQYRPKSTH